MRILIVEDDADLRELLQRRLGKEQYNVDAAGDGETALLYLDSGEYDCVVLDIMLPERDGLSVLKSMRSRNIATPVLLLTAKDTVEDRIKGLDSGADDYLTKPFAHGELSARLRALLRRREGGGSDIISFENLRMDTASRKVHRDGKPIELAAKEYTMLEYFMRNPGRVLTRNQIIEYVWGYDFDNDSNVVDVYIRYLRRKVDEGFEPRLIQTLRGVGYVMRAE